MLAVNKANRVDIIQYVSPNISDYNRICEFAIRKNIDAIAYIKTFTRPIQQIALDKLVKDLEECKANRTSITDYFERLDVKINSAKSLYNYLKPISPDQQLKMIKEIDHLGFLYEFFKNADSDVYGKAAVVLSIKSREYFEYIFPLLTPYSLDKILSKKPEYSDYVIRCLKQDLSNREDMKIQLIKSIEVDPDEFNIDISDENAVSVKNLFEIFDIKVQEEF